jgi:hypothetical protein
MDISVSKGDTVLIPAAMDYYVISGKASILNLQSVIERLYVLLQTQIKIKKKWQILRI